MSAPMEMKMEPKAEADTETQGVLDQLCAYFETASWLKPACWSLRGS